ncbi:RNA polymerase factor sigma-54 [Christensenellaceae bacterium OttesenSCG-928-K19]|nr:RNA polymerase factor sigma-54 [Christensenellaceae bacterium OttesenSCG-928-K19]
MLATSPLCETGTLSICDELYYMRLELQTKQTLQMSPRMEQSLAILGMNDLELTEHLEEFVQKNPLVEIDRPTEREQAKLALSKKLEWLQGDPENKVNYWGGEEPPPIENISEPEEDAYVHLMRQLGETKLEGTLKAATAYLISRLNSDGYLTKEIGELAGEGCPKELLLEALAILQEFDPPGVGARNLGECLALQLKQAGKLTHAREVLVQKHLYDMCTRKWKLVSKQTGIAEEDIKKEYDVIRKLNPRPCAALNTDYTQSYIKPEIFIRHMPDGGFAIEFEERVPRVAIGSYYREMLKNTDDKEVVDYISGQLQNAKWLMNCLESRRKTIHAVVEAIVRRQEGFFLRGENALVPMKLMDIAQMVDLHESTVSRAISGKYLECDFGVYEIKKLFQGTRGNNKGNCQSTVQQVIKRLIENEDGGKPLSDQKLSDLLKEEGLSASRRTVTKYREQLGIAASAFRKS